MFEAQGHPGAEATAGSAFPRLFEGMFIIHKSGQGYWTRLMSLIGGGALSAAGAMWAWSKLSAVEIPVRAWNFTFSDATGTTPPAGARIDVLGRNGEVIDSGIVDVASDSSLSLTGLDGDFGEDVTALATDSGFRAPVDPPQIERLFQQEYLQGGVAAVILLIGLAIVYYFCYANRRSSEFMIATEGEMKKVNWSTRREIFGSTWVVIVISLIIAAVLFFADFIFSQFFTWIRVLEIA